ncbi:acetolactate synthase large subunit, partial [Aliarcobacter lanthieri]
DENHPMCLSAVALSKDDFVHSAIDRADIIINVGHDVIEKPPLFMSNKEGATKDMHINFFPSEVDDTYFPQMRVVGDIACN